jgi:hypothetical protein
LGAVRQTEQWWALCSIPYPIVNYTFIRVLKEIPTTTILAASPGNVLKPEVGRVFGEGNTWNI